MRKVMGLVVLLLFSVVLYVGCGGGGGRGGGWSPVTISPTDLSTPIKAVNNLSTAFKTGDSSKALQYVETTLKEKFQDEFNLLGSEGMKLLGDALDNAVGIKETELFATYKITITTPKDGEVECYFQMIKTGAGWKLYQL